MSDRDIVNGRRGHKPEDEPSKKTGKRKASGKRKPGEQQRGPARQNESGRDERQGQEGGADQQQPVHPRRFYVAFVLLALMAFAFVLTLTCLGIDAMLPVLWVGVLLLVLGVVLLPTRSGGDSVLLKFLRALLAAVEAWRNGGGGL
ncbi:hypothetical protein ACWDT6_19825 [Nocardia grenadensis]